MGHIVIDPVTRIEGHLKVEAVVEDGVVKEAISSGTLFRGLELILKGRDPRDAQRITQRICGVCPTSHSVAAALNLDSAFGIGDKIPDNGRLLRNLILGAAHIADHVLHFYHLVALDYVDVATVGDYEGNDPTLSSIKAFAQRGQLAPFVPRYEGDYRLPYEANQQMVQHYARAFDIRRKSQEMLALFGGKMPHNVGVLPGGVAAVPTVDSITSFYWRLKELKQFIDDVYLPDVLAVAQYYPDYVSIGQGCGRLLAYGSYDLEGGQSDLTRRERLFKAGTATADLQAGGIDTSLIAEQVRYSWYSDDGARHPSQGVTEPHESKRAAYSWLKAPRYGGEVYEVGPLARILVNYAAGNGVVRNALDRVLDGTGIKPDAMCSVVGRHLARALETRIVADSMLDWILQVKPDEPGYLEYELPADASGMGLVGAARGALGHWVEISEGRIANYQVITPSTWNMSPKDDEGQPGPLEQAITGTRIQDEDNPFEVVRIIRSFDPCLACSVHLLDVHGHARHICHVS
ncbi:MAG: nickel-dependent hydrogenase large subunit [Chloroflexota bacterium]